MTAPRMLLSLALALICQIASAAPKPVDESAVDKAALAAQKKGIQKTQELLKKYRGTGREAILLERLAESLQESANIEFRISHANAHKRGAAKPDLKAHQSAMKQSIEALNRLIQAYPGYETIDRAYFLRGKAYEELEDKVRARSDYLHMVKNFPESPETTSAYMSLGEFAVEAGKHEEAVVYFKQVEKRPETPQYPFALYKLAWSEFNLKKIPEALEYQRKHVAYYRFKQKQQGVLTPSDKALMENSFMDYPLFYLEGFEKNHSEFPVASALDQFKDLDKGSDKNPMIGKMLTRFAKLLRAHDHEQPLTEWTDLLMDKENERPESLETISILFDFYKGKRKYFELSKVTPKFISLYEKRAEIFQKTDAYKNAQRQLIETSDEIQKLTIKNKNSPEVRKLSQALANVYLAFTKIVSPEDTRVPRVHYNLAETLFEIGDYEGATEHYRWVVDRRVNQKDLSSREAAIKAISSQYRVLKADKTIPGELKPQSLEDDSDKSLPEKLGRWVEWIDTYAKDAADNDEVFYNFYFEACRTIYASGRIKDATDRMQEFALDHPDSKFAIPAASLVLDTSIHTKDWAKTHTLARKLIKVKQWKGSKFAGVLDKTAADSFYKIMDDAYKAGNTAEVLEKAEDFRSLYATHARLEDVYHLASKAAIDATEDEKAEAYLNKLINEFPQSPLRARAFANRGKIREKKYDFARAVDDYRSYLNSLRKDEKPETSIKDLRKKILELALYSGNWDELKKAIKEEKECQGELSTLCDRLEGLRNVYQSSEDSADALYRKAKRDSFKDNRPIWAAAALVHSGKLKLHERLQAIRYLAGDWSDLDPADQLILLPSISESVTKAFAQCRAELKTTQKLKATETSIKRRMENIRELENTGTRAVKLPWARVRASVLSEIAESYLEFARGLGNLENPKDLPAAELEEYKKTIQEITLPFEEKGQELRGKAFEIAAASAIEDQTLRSILDPYFKDNPSTANSLAIDRTAVLPVGFDYETFTSLDRETSWDSFRSPKTPSPQSLWLSAIEGKRWTQAAYFVGEITKKKLLPETSLSLMRSYTLARMGAQAEAFAELAEVRSSFKDKTRLEAEMLLLQQYLNSHSKDRVKSTVDTIRDRSDDKRLIRSARSTEEAFLLGFGAIWSGYELDDINTSELLEKAERSPIRGQAEWARKARLARMGSKTAKGRVQ